MLDQISTDAALFIMSVFVLFFFNNPVTIRLKLFLEEVNVSFFLFKELCKKMEIYCACKSKPLARFLQAKKKQELHTNKFLFFVNLVFLK